MASFEEPDDILSPVLHGSFHSTGWVAQSHNMVGDVRQIQIEAVDLQPPLLQGDELS